MTKKILMIIGVFFLISVFISIFRSSPTTTKQPSTQRVPTSQETTVENDLTISKEKFEYYNDVFLKLSKLQGQYEQIYSKFGMVDLEAAKKIPEDVDFPKYGSVTRQISTIYNGLSKFNIDMTPGEKFLIFKATDYGGALIFLTPDKKNLKGMDFVIESKAVLENGLKQVKDFNKF